MPWLETVTFGMVTRRFSADVGAGFEEDFQKRMEFPFPVGNRGRTDVLGD